MSNATQINEHLDADQVNAYIDRELSPGDTDLIQQHLQDCHSCSLRILSATQLKTATAAAEERYAPPPEALSRLAAQLRQPQSQEQPKKTARLYSFGSPKWALIAAGLVVAISLAGWRQVRQDDRFAAELLDQHLATLSSGASPEVISTDRHTVKPWFQGKLPFSFNLPDTLPADTTLKGGNLTYLDGHPAALLLFTIHKHDVSVFLTQRSGSLDAKMRSGTRSGFDVYSATTHDLHMTAVSDVNPADLAQLVSSLANAQAPADR